MKPGRGIATAFLIVGAAATVAAQQGIPDLEGPYLGQPPPGTIPEIFAPGVISTDAVEACLTFSFDGRYLVFRTGFRADTAIWIMEKKAGVWSQPEPAPFFVKEFGFGDFTFSPSSPELFFTSRRPFEKGGEGTESANLWKVAYDGDGWREPVSLGNAVNSGLHESYPSVSSDGTMYFFRRFEAEDGLSEIMRSGFVDGVYATPERMGPEINTRWDEWDPCISPDGTFLIFCSKKPSSFGGDDLYVSFRKDEGGWTEAINLGETINSPHSENRPFITADGSYLFFNSDVSGNRDVFWVSLEAVSRLDPR